MTIRPHAAAASAALLAALALPLTAPAATTSNTAPQQYVLQTRLVEQYHAGEYDGTLRLAVAANGIVQGTYLPIDGPPRMVTGGLTGDDVWLEIGLDHPLRLTGTFSGGVLRTTAQIPGPDRYTFESVNGNGAATR